MQTQTSVGEGKTSQENREKSSSQTICSCDNGAGRDGSQGCFVPFAGCPQPSTCLSRLGSPLVLPLSLAWQCRTQKPPRWSLLRFFSTGGCEFSICICAYTIIFYLLARSHYGFILCLRFALLHLFLPAYHSSWPRPFYQYPDALPALSSLPKYGLACISHRGKNTPLESCVWELDKRMSPGNT